MANSWHSLYQSADKKFDRRWLAAAIMSSLSRPMGIENSRKKARTSYKVRARLPVSFFQVTGEEKTSERICLSRSKSAKWDPASPPLTNQAENWILECRGVPKPPSLYDCFSPPQHSSFRFVKFLSYFFSYSKTFFFKQFKKLKTKRTTETFLQFILKKTF